MNAIRNGDGLRMGMGLREGRGICGVGVKNRKKAGSQGAAAL